jgi:hypothetical protein
MYKQQKKHDVFGTVIGIEESILRLSDNAYIPFDLKWLAEGNTPLPADEVTE